MKQKTVRFYDDAPDDMNALRILDGYRKYGFNSAREMVVAAVNSYVQEGNSRSLELSRKNIDEIAEKIANKLKNMNVTINKNTSIIEENVNKKVNDNNDNYQKALSFMETL